MHFYCAIVAFSVLLSVCQSAVNITTNEVKFRLPNNTKPESYDIKLVTYFEEKNFTFSGTVAIDVRVLEATQNITLHVHELLSIESVKLESEAKNDVKLDQLAYDKTNQQLTIPTIKQLETGTKYILTIQYTGELRSDSPTGFYRSSYVDSTGQEK